MNDKRQIELVYDKQCPACDLYCKLIDVRETEGQLVRVDARDPGDVMSEVTALGLDIDEGMVLKVDDRLYYGADAIHELALLSSHRGFFNRLASLTFRSPAAARILYPPLRAMRNLLLKILGRTRINNLGRPNRDRF